MIYPAITCVSKAWLSFSIESLMNDRFSTHLENTSKRVRRVRVSERAGSLFKKGVCSFLAALHHNHHSTLTLTSLCFSRRLLLPRGLSVWPEVIAAYLWKLLDYCTVHGLVFLSRKNTVLLMYILRSGWGDLQVLLGQRQGQQCQPRVTFRTNSGRESSHSTQRVIMHIPLAHVQEDGQVPVRQVQPCCYFQGSVKVCTRGTSWSLLASTPLCYFAGSL